MKSPEQWGPGCKPRQGEETHAGADEQISAPSEGGGGGWGVPSHSRGITGWDPPTGRSRNHLRAAWGGICAAHRQHACKNMAEWSGYRCNFGCWCPQRHPCSCVPTVTSSRCCYPKPQLLAQASRRASSKPPVTCKCPCQHPAAPGRGQGQAAQPDTRPPSHTAINLYFHGRQRTVKVVAGLPARPELSAQI